MAALLGCARLHWRGPLAPGGPPYQQSAAAADCLRRAVKAAVGALPASAAHGLLSRALTDGYMPLAEAGVPAVSARDVEDLVTLVTDASGW